MSNRYVWERYNRIYEIKERPNAGTYEAIFYYPEDENLNDYEHSHGSNYVTNLQVDSSGNITATVGAATGEKPRNGRYFTAYIEFEGDTKYAGGYRYFKAGTNTDVVFNDDHSQSPNHVYSLTVWKAHGVYSTAAKGSAAGNSSNAASSTYPPCDAAGRITSICAVLPIMRRCRDVQ